MKPRTLLCALLAILWLTGPLIKAGVTAILADQAQNTGNTFSAASCFPAYTDLLSPSAQAADTGGDGNGFELNPTNAFADGGGNASNVNGAGDQHRYYGYGISVPSGCSVTGVEVRLDWWLDNTFGTNSMSVDLSWNGGASWTPAETDSTETTSEHTATLGSSTDTWGHPWTVDELSDTNFLVRLTSNSTSAYRDFYLDWVPVRVYYGAGGGGGASAPAVLIPAPPATSTPTPVVTATPTATPVDTPTSTPTPVGTYTATVTCTVTDTPAPTDTPVATPPPAATPTPS